MITDDTIRELRARAAQDDDRELVAICNMALGNEAREDAIEEMPQPLRDRLELHHVPHTIFARCNVESAMRWCATVLWYREVEDLLEAVGATFDRAAVCIRIQQRGHHVVITDLREEDFPTEGIREGFLISVDQDDAEIVCTSEELCQAVRDALGLQYTSDGATA